MLSGGVGQVVPNRNRSTRNSAATGGAIRVAYPGVDDRANDVPAAAQRHIPIEDADTLVDCQRMTSGFEYRRFSQGTLGTPGRTAGRHPEIHELSRRAFTARAAITRLLGC
jgi:hypothetical protein